MLRLPASMRWKPDAAPPLVEEGLRGAGVVDVRHGNAGRAAAHRSGHIKAFGGRRRSPSG